MTIARGDVWWVAQRGLYEGKPRPAVLIQAEGLDDHDSLLFCLIYSSADARRDTFFRIAVEPSEANGLDAPSIVAADKVVTIRRDKLRHQCGVMEEGVMGLVNEALLTFQGLR